MTIRIDRLVRGCTFCFLVAPLILAFSILAGPSVAQDAPNEPSDSDSTSNPTEESPKNPNESRPIKGKTTRKSRSGGDKKDADSTSQEPGVEQTAGLEYFAPRKIDMSFGMRFYANANLCTKLHATIPFPLNWPEQSIKVTSSEIPENVAWAFRDLPEGKKQSAQARQLVMDIASLNPNDELSLVVHVEVEKYFISPPADTSVFVIPKNLPAEMNWFMKKSPYIDIELSEIRRVAKEIAAQNHDSAWAHVESLFDWVRKNIEYRNGPILDIKTALKKRQGDCEEMTSIFVALCRASKIPARCVWIPDHCYPEFYLEDPQGEGHWFPCQVAGDRQFGQMHDYRPILQKGDRFIVPEKQGPVRYIESFFTCKKREAGPGLDPSVEEVLDIGPLKAEIAALQAEAAAQGIRGNPEFEGNNEEQKSP